MEHSSKPVALRFNSESDADLLQALEGAPNRSARIKYLMRLGLSKEDAPIPPPSRVLVEQGDAHLEIASSIRREEDLEAILAGSSFDGL